jgi:gamma-glutamyltranspeptidase/glutathione hydrolase
MWAELVRGRTQFWGQVVLEGHPNDVGYGSIMVPGTLAGLAELHVLLGRRPWRDCVAPAIELAREGFGVRTGMQRFWSIPREPELLLQGDERLRRFPETARHYLGPDGSFPAVGDTLVNEDLARLLERIADEGVACFYTGDVAETIAADLAANGSTITRDDLAAFAPAWHEPLRATYHGRDVFSIQPPGGGITILQMLLMLEAAGAQHLEPWSPATGELFADVSRVAFADRTARVGDPRFVDVPVDELLDSARAAQLVEEIRAGRPAIAGPSSELGDTTHLSVVDADGSAVSLTHTIGSGSGVTTPGLGFMWNNSFYLADPRPGRPNSIEPGKARLTGMAPTMLFEEGRLAMVVGSPGGSGIVTAIAQAIRNVVAYGMTATEAVAFPRLHAEGSNVRVEGRFDRRLVNALEERGLTVLFGPDGLHRGGVGFVEMIVLRQPQADGPWLGRRLDPGSDPRGDAAALWA